MALIAAEKLGLIESYEVRRTRWSWEDKHGGMSAQLRRALGSKSGSFLCLHCSGTPVPALPHALHQCHVQCIVPVKQGLIFGSDQYLILQAPPSTAGAYKDMTVYFNAA